MSATPRCEPVRELVWAPDGARTPEEEALLQAHLAECADCRAAVAASRRVAASLAELPTVAAPMTLRERTLAELDARRAAAAAANGATPSSMPPLSLDTRRRRSLPIALRVALPLAATLALAVVWWQSRVEEPPALESAATSAPSGRDDEAREGDSKELLALVPAEKAAEPAALDSFRAPVPDPEATGADRSGLLSDAGERKSAGEGPGAPGAPPVAGGRTVGGVRGVPVGAPRGAPPAPGTAGAPQQAQHEQEAKPADPRSVALLAAATPADALRLVALQRAATYGGLPELASEQERHKEYGSKDAPKPKEAPLDQGVGGGGGGDAAKKRAALEERDGEEYGKAAPPTELRYAEWSPTSPREQELLAEWSRRGARQGDLLVIDLAPEELEARRYAESGFVDFADDDRRVLRQVDDPEQWWKATWRAEEVAKRKSAVKAGDPKSGDAKSGDAPARPAAATGSSRGQSKQAPEKAPVDQEKADRDDATRHDEEARAAKARRVRVVVRLIDS